MTILTTERMLLLPLTQAVIQSRLESERFEADFDVSTAAPNERSMVVRFLPAWPGDLLAVFPSLLATLPPGTVAEGQYIAVERTGGLAIGALGTKGHPDAGGIIEIGYGFNPESWGHGYATEAVVALVDHLLDAPGVLGVSAQTAVSNRASERVLEKSGFIRVGTSWEEDDGDLIVWQHKGAQ